MLFAQLGAGRLFAAGGLAALLQEGHGRLGGGLLADVRFEDQGPARPAIAWAADTYRLYAAPPPAVVLDTTLLLLHLADRDTAVAQALAANGCAAALRSEVASAGQQVRPWTPARDDALAVAGTEAREEPIRERSGALPVLVGNDIGRLGVPMYATIQADGAVAIAPFDSGLPVEQLTRMPPPPPIVADGLAAIVRAPRVLAIGNDGEPVLAIGGTGGEVAFWWPSRGRIEAGPAHGSAVSCLAAGEAGGPVIASGDTAGTVLITRLRDGEPIAAIQIAGAVRDLDLATVDGRPLLAVLDERGEVAIWDLADLRVVTGAHQPITGVTRVRFGEQSGAPALLVRDLGGAPEIRRLAWVCVADQVPEYRSDETAQARSLPLGDDALGREHEADAIAELITSGSVQPPLAIGLFGEWGEGKSWFMERVQAHVDERAARAATVPPGAPTIACRHVKQVRFNAWHYAETDLWASLVAELFNQLGRTADGEELRRQARLRAELVRRTKVPQRLAEVQAYLAATEDRPVLPAYDELPANVRDRWVRAVGPARAEQTYIRLNHSAGALQRRVAGPLAVAWAVARARPLRTVLVVGVALAAIVALALAASAWWGSVVAAFAAVAGAVAVAAPIVAWIAGKARAGWNVLRSAARQVSVLDTTRAVAQAEEAQLQGEYERLVAGGQLAGVLEQRVQDGSYRSRLGLMSQIRDDFGEMAELLDSRVSAAGEDEFPHIDRIVLYVDDLDRCPPGRVVEVLEAIHLLLAVRLFVVVVAVDPRWLLQALTTHYRGLLRDTDGDAASGEEELWRSTPLHYLEKIFQVPFTLSPLDTTRYERFVDRLLARPEPPGPPGPRPPVEPVARGGAADGGDARASRSVAAPTARWHVIPRTDVPVRLPGAPRTEQIDPLLLEDVEREFIKLLGPPLLTSPRSTKRLLNSYGLLLSLEGPEGRRAIVVAPTGPAGAAPSAPVPPCRAALALLAAVIGRPDAAPAFFRHLHDAEPAKTWLQFLDEEDIRLGGADLASALGHLTRAAAAAGQPLPETVGDFQSWVVKTGRLSFQTGREVVRLA
jgi:hypothetical protein